MSRGRGAAAGRARFVEAVAGPCVLALALSCLALPLAAQAGGGRPAQQGGGDAPDLATLEGAPTSVMVDGQTLLLAARLWRDFMPLSPPDGRPLRAVLTVTTLAGQPLPEGLSLDRVWVINGAEVWSGAVASRQDDGRNPSTASWIAEDGPKWGPGIAVDVVVRLRGAAGSPALLKVAGVLITRTD